MFNFQASEVPAVKSSMEMVAAILAIVADPKMAQEHLDQMKAATENIAKLHADLNNKTIEADHKLDERHEQLEARAAELDGRAAKMPDIDAAKAAADHRLVEATAAERKARELHAALDERDHMMTQREVALAAREHSHAAAQQKLATDRASVERMAEDLKSRIEKMRAVVG